MVFSSPIFLFLFLPLTLAVHCLLPHRARNFWLLATSLVFYGWGEPRFLPVMVASIGANFLLALWIDHIDDAWRRRLAVALAIVLNIGLLVAFKYTSFLVDGLNVILRAAGQPSVFVPAIVLPIGISFFTFHALSYVIDVYRRDAPALRNPLDMGLYIALFSQLVAGPIIRYHDIAHQLGERRIDRAMFARGVERFVVGLGKKVLIANTVAVPADFIFSLPADQLTAPIAWLGVICYTLQIYFDFSGYSDMAIGLGLMFGFRFLENFNYPYIAQSVTEFWRRWHISLSTWFRDYLYIPLGGNRGAPWHTYRNLVIVFFLCGLWHGASWNFIVWGLLHGSLLVVERTGLGRVMVRWPSVLRHAWTLVFVMIAWVLFRANSLPHAWGFLQAMMGVSAPSGVDHPLALYLDAPVLLALAAGVVGATPVLHLFRQRVNASSSRAVGIASGAGEIAALSLVLITCSMMLAAGTYNPFIYFRF